MVLVVIRPGDVHDFLYLSCDGVESGIEESLTQAALEFLARQLDVSLSLAHFRCVHVWSRNHALART